MTEAKNTGAGGELAGRKALITGGTKGLGLAVARLFARQGCDIYLSYRSDQPAAEAAVASVRALGVRCEARAVDLSEETAADALFDWLAGQTAVLDIYVHNAAATAFKDLMDLKPHHIDKTLNITLKSLILGTQRAAGLMPRGGAIVTVSGMDTLKAVPRHGLLGAAKSALETLTAYLAHELAPRGIRANCVNPGFLETESTRKYLGAGFDEVSRGFARTLPLHRTPSLDEVAEVILFLASRRSSWMVGQTLNADGGLDFSMSVPMGAGDRTP